MSVQARFDSMIKSMTKKSLMGSYLNDELLKKKREIEREALVNSVLRTREEIWEIVFEEKLINIDKTWLTKFKEKILYISKLPEEGLYLKINGTDDLKKLTELL